MRHFSTITLVLWQLTTALAANNVCSSGIYAVLAPLSTYPPATSYCAKKYPGTVTVTVTASTPRKREVMATITKHVDTKSTTTAKDPHASIFSSLVSQASGVVSTFCNCIGYPKTTTITSSTTPSTTPATTPSTTTSTATCGTDATVPTASCVAAGCAGTNNGYVACFVPCNFAQCDESGYHYYPGPTNYCAQIDGSGFC